MLLCICTRNLCAWQVLPGERSLNTTEEEELLTWHKLLNLLIFFLQIKLPSTTFAIIIVRQVLQSGSSAQERLSYRHPLVYCLTLSSLMRNVWGV